MMQDQKRETTRKQGHEREEEEPLQVRGASLSTNVLQVTINMHKSKASSLTELSLELEYSLNMGR